MTDINRELYCMKRMMVEVILLALEEAAGTRKIPDEYETAPDSAEDFIQTDRLNNFIDYWQLNLDPGYVRKGYDILKCRGTIKRQRHVNTSRGKCR